MKGCNYFSHNPMYKSLRVDAPTCKKLMLILSLSLSLYKHIYTCTYCLCLHACVPAKNLILYNFHFFFWLLYMGFESSLCFDVCKLEILIFILVFLEMIICCLISK